MARKKYSKGNGNNILRNSIVVGLVLLFFDFLAHTFLTGTQETFYYYLAKPIVAGYIAFFMFLGIWNFFNLKKNTNLYYFYYAILFALTHGIYYRIIDLVQGNPFFDRVNDIVLGNTVLFSSSSILMGTIGWAIIHGGSFLIAVFIAKKLKK